MVSGVETMNGKKVVKKLILRNSTIIFLLSSLIILISTHGNKLYDTIYELLDKDQGKLKIFSVDAKKGFPIKDTEFRIIDLETGNIVEVLNTDSSGMAISNLLYFDKTYKITQTNVMEPYVLNKEQYVVEFSEKNDRVTINNDVPTYIKDYERTEDKEIIITNLQLSLDTILQYPELPNGCEVTALASVLDYYGYKTTKMELAEKYLPKVPFSQKKNKLFGVNPYDAYAGDPSSKSGFFSYAPPIVRTANEFIQSNDGKNNSKDISGSTRNEILKYLKEGTPVIVWTTRDLSEPNKNFSWYIKGTNEILQVPTNSHTVVLTGFSEEIVYAMDPLRGQVVYDSDQFFEIYGKAGSHAMVIL